MTAATVVHSDLLSVIDYRCDLGPDDRPFPELHDVCSISYVREGSFGYRYGSQTFELVAGAVMLGRAGDEYTCTHEHVGCGDACLSFRLSPQLLDAVGLRRETFELARIQPLPELMVLGELAGASVRGASDVALDEVGVLFTQRLAELVSGAQTKAVAVSARDRRRAVEAAQFLEAHAGDELDLETTAAAAGLSPFHFLRVFRAVLGVTPHQYLVRLRLKRAAQLLADAAHAEQSVTEVAFSVGFADLSNFVRTFQRAAGMPPGRFRALASGKRLLR